VRLPVSASLTYTRYAAQPLLGFNHRREGLTPAASLALTPNWSITGNVLFDMDKYLDQRETYVAAYGFNPATAVYRRSDMYSVAAAGVTIGYRDECTTFSVSYSASPILAATGTTTEDKTVLVRLELRSLGQLGFAQNLTGANTADGIGTR
jgi:LPS-assembly protein